MGAQTVEGACGLPTPAIEMHVKAVCEVMTEASRAHLKAQAVTPQQNVMLFMLACKVMHYASQDAMVALAQEMQEKANGTGAD